MENRVNKPRVFLSHSKADVAFIDRLFNDLRRCQIDPWLDTEEIRDGKPWLKVIFEDGIPTCDVILVFLTENSIASKMVAKEIDAAIIEQLTEKGISLIPYVSDASLRNQIRGDIRSLQCREWNLDNYDDVLPSVVAEIWRSYLERVVKLATLQETNRRLELEIELRKLQEQSGDSVFTQSEDKDFRYIYSKLNITVDVLVSVHVETEGLAVGALIVNDVFRASILFLIKVLLEDHYEHFSRDAISRLLQKIIRPLGPITRTHNKARFMLPSFDSSFVLELRQYGLTKPLQEVNTNPVFGRTTTIKDIFTDKLYRFFYWLDYGNHLIGEIEYIEFNDDQPDD